jgi:putative redox protein
MEAEVMQTAGGTFVGRCNSNHWVVMDCPEPVGGHNAGSTPMELVLMAMGGCTGIDLVSLFKKMRVEYDRLQIKLSAKRAEEHPKGFTEIEIRYILTGENVDEEKVKKAIELSMEKYCSVTNMIKKAAKVTYTTEIIKARASPLESGPAHL